MISGTLTLFNWSLRSDVRSIYPHIVRACFAGFMLLSIASAYAGSLTGVGPGLKFFQSICFLNTLLIAVSGISYFVSAVTEEKDSGTLALLRLAGVTPLAIVLSKSTSRYLSAVMLLAIQLPFTFLAITLGGVTWQQIIAAYLALAAWMWLVANLALFCSVRCRTSGRAATLAAALLLVFLSGPALLSTASASLTALNVDIPPLKEFFNSSSLWLQDISVYRRLDMLLSASGPHSLMNKQFSWSFLAGGVLFLLSVIFFNRYAHPADDNAHGRSAAVRRFTVGRCWSYAIIWKDFLFFTGGRTFFFVKLLGYGLLIAGFCVFHMLDHPTSQVWIPQDMVWICFVTLVAFMTLEMLLFASGSLFTEVRQTTLATLVMLPVSTGRLLLQKAAACLLALVPVLSWMVFVTIMFPQTIAANISGTMVVTVVFEVMLCVHLTILLSLYTRWAALPLAVFLTAASFMCCPFVTLAVFEFSENFARLNGISWGLFLGSLANLVWAWMFVLLPIEIEIANRWRRLSQQ